MVLSSIVTYNPDIKRLKENIESLKSQSDKILIIDNKSDNIGEINELVETYKEIQIIKNLKNDGIAKALNQILIYAKESKSEWVLLMDQDSVIEDRAILKYKKFLKENIEKEIMILSPNIVDRNLNEKYVEENKSKEINLAITSGTFLNVEKALEIGGFLEKLFIDYVDFEFSLRAKKYNYKIYKIYNIKLLHELGQREYKKILGRKFDVTNHNPKRRYYLIRNKIYIYKNYLHIFPKICIRNIMSTIKVIGKIILCEKNKKENIVNILEGIKDSKNF
ncbi:MAG: glycosyltransferase family 2 protein [Clostridium sp.]